MSKVQSVIVKEKNVSTWDDFKGLKSGDYRITYCYKTKRADLYANKGADFIISDVSLSVLKREAEARFGILEDSWKNPEQEQREREQQENSETK